MKGEIQGLTENKCAGMQGITSGERIMTSRRVCFWDCADLLINITGSKSSMYMNCEHWPQRVYFWDCAELPMKISGSKSKKCINSSHRSTSADRH